MRKRFSGIESGATFWYRIGQATSLPKLLLQRTPFSCNPPSLELQLDQKELLFGLSSSAKTSLTYYALTYLVLGLIVEIPSF